MSINTMFLLHANGTAGDTPATDEVGNTLTWVGSAEISITQKKFGTASLYLSGSSDGSYITVPQGPTFQFSTSNFTVDFWLYPAVPGAWTSIFAMGMASAGGTNMLQLRYRPTTGGYKISINGGGDIITSGITWTAGVWQHIAVVRDDTNFLRLYIGGTAAGSYDMTGVTLNDGAPTLTFGLGGDGWINDFAGYYDEFRISDIARWTAAFTVSTAEYGYIPPVVGGTYGATQLNLDVNRKLKL